MKEAPGQILREGDTTIYPDTIRQFIGRPFLANKKKNLKTIASCRHDFDKWATNNFVEIVGFSWEIKDRLICGTMYGKMLRPELAYMGRYPVFEHERV